MPQPPKKSLKALFDEELGPVAKPSAPQPSSASPKTLTALFDQELGAAPARRPVAPPTAPETPADATVPTQRLRTAIGQGALFGFGDEAEAALRAATTGETYEQALADIRGKLEAYRGDRPGEALAAELVGGVATGVAGGARALAATAGRRGAAELAKTLARTAATGAVTQGALSGAGGAEGDLASRAYGAAAGGTLGAVLPYLGGRLISKLPTEPLAAGYMAAQRGVANLLEGTPLQSFGRMVEPTDAVRIQREAAAALPGGAGAQGVTTLSIPSAGPAARQAESQAAVAVEQGRSRVRAALAAQREAEAAQDVAMQQAKREAGAAKALTGQRAEAVTKMGSTRAKRLTAAAEEAELGATTERSLAKTEVKALRGQAEEQAKTAAEDVLAQVRAEAGEVLGGLRGQQQRGSAAVLQETIRKNQLATAKKTYQEIRRLGSPTVPDETLYSEMLEDPRLLETANEAFRALQREARKVPPGELAPVLRTRTLKTAQGEDLEVPELSLELMDQMRRRLVEPQVKKGSEVLGLSASARREVLDTINSFEDRFLASFGTDEAAEALRNARTLYRNDFLKLSAIQDGLGLGTAKAGRASGLLAQSRKELDEVVKRVGAMSVEQREAFHVGAKEWFDRVLQENDDDALKLAQKFKSEASRRRLALAYGEDAVEALRQFAPETVGKRTAAAAQAVRGEAKALAESLVGRREQAAQALESRAERARGLAERAKTAKAERATQLQEQQRATSLQDLLTVQRQTGVPVAQARAATQAAQTEAARLAEELGQARIARQQAKAAPMKLLEGALGTSDAQQRFLQALYPNMTSAQQQQSVAVLGSKVQNRLQDMVRQGKSPQEILKEINVLRQNDAVRTLFGPQMDAFVQNLAPTAATRLPTRIRPTLTGMLSRRIGSLMPQEQE